MDDVIVPQYAHPGDAGMDVFSRETKVLEPGGRYGFALGFAAQPPAGYVVFVKPKSGLAAKHGLHTLAGVIDEGYRGEYIVWMINLGQEPVTIEAGQKLAQLVLLPAVQAEVVACETLDDTSRGQGNFGSTGK